MSKIVFDQEAYYKKTTCENCRQEMTEAEIAKCKKEGFLRVCKKCYDYLKELFAKCLPLLQKLSP